VLEPVHAPRPLLGVAAALALGAWVGEELPFPAAPLVLVLVGAVLLLCLIGPRAAGAVAGILAAAFGIGAAGHSIERHAYERAGLSRFMVEEDPDSPVWIEGRAAADSRRNQDRVQLLIDVESLRWCGRARPLSGRARVSVSDAEERLEMAQGEAVSLWATLHAPRGYLSPGAFDVLADARRRGVHAHGFCKSTALLRPGGIVPQGGLTLRIAAWRRAARRVIVEQLPPGDEEGLVRAMVLGDRAGLSSDASEAFRIAGTYHVLAISGAQVALVAGLLLLLLRRMRVAPLPSALALAASVSLYALFVGADPPVTRAALMALCLGLGKALDLDGDLANLLGFAAAALLVYEPSAVGDVSFQLSFGATLGILLLLRPVSALLPALPLQAELAIAVSLAAQAALLPALAAHFHRLAPAALVLNLAAGPLSAAVLFSGFALLVVHALAPALSGLAADVSWICAHALLRSGDAVRALPWLDLRVPTPSCLAVLVYFLGLALFFRGRRALGGGVLLATLLALCAGPGVSADGKLRLSVLDVGNGDALVLRSPSGRVLMVDAGPATRSFDLGEAVVGPFLWSLGARRLDRLVLTHLDGDHVGGAPFLRRAFAIGQLWEGFAPQRDPRYERLSQGLDGLRRVSLRAGGRLAWDEVGIEVLGPPLPPRGRRLGGNDDSLVLRLRYRAVTLLLMGDAQRDAEASLPPLRADVLKVGHHGSATGTGAAFLARTHPRVALISAGVQNAFGHPHPAVLSRLAAAGALTLRTDRDGTLTVVTDGARLWLETHRD
jgi:competence protein ComEC